MGRTIWVLAVVVAFVAGSIVTGTLAFADKDDKGNPFKRIAEQLENIAMAIEGIGTIKGDQGEQGEQGPEGEQGPQGEQGPTGVMNIYEVSAVSIIPAIDGSGIKGNPVQLRCLDGDWLLREGANEHEFVFLSIGDLSVDDLGISARGTVVKEFETNVQSNFLKTIGFDGFALRGKFLSPSFEITATITILCLSPSP